MTSRTTFVDSRLPRTSIAWFLFWMVVAYGCATAAWRFFPGENTTARTARIVLPFIGAAVVMVVSRRLLTRDGIDPDRLGLRLTLRHAACFCVGSMVGALWVMLMAGGLWMVVRFHWERGPLSWSEASWRAGGYFAGNLGEELFFRGYLLLILARAWGLPRALLLLAVLFGLFHLPGLAGLALLKMIATTGVGSFLFAYAFLTTGTLWTAVSLHVAGNIMLHTITGLSGGPAILQPVMDDPWPTSYDPAFWAWMFINLPLVLLLYLSPLKPSSFVTRMKAYRQTQ